MPSTKPKPFASSSSPGSGTPVTLKPMVPLPATVWIVQGEDMGRPGLLRVDIQNRPEVDVTGAAVEIR